MISTINQFPICGSTKSINAAIIIFKHSPLVTRPNSRLAIPVSAKIRDRIPIIKPEILFRKMQIHKISVSAHIIGNSITFKSIRIILIAVSLTNNLVCSSIF